MKSRSYVKGKWRLGRLRIRMSLLIRRIEFAESFKRRLVERLRETVDRIRDAEERIARLEQKLRRDVQHRPHEGRGQVRVQAGLQVLQELGREPTSEEIAKRMDIPVSKTLTPREERVIKMRFGIGDGSEHTLEEVGQSFQVTRERIRQIEAKALRKLRHPSRSRKLKAFLEGSRI